MLEAGGGAPSPRATACICRLYNSFLNLDDSFTSLKPKGKIGVRSIRVLRQWCAPSAKKQECTTGDQDWVACLRAGRQYSIYGRTFPMSCDYFLRLLMCKNKNLAERSPEPSGFHSLHHTDCPSGLLRENRPYTSPIVRSTRRTNGHNVHVPRRVNRASLMRRVALLQNVASSVMSSVVSSPTLMIFPMLFVHCT